MNDETFEMDSIAPDDRTDKAVMYNESALLNQDRRENAESSIRLSGSLDDDVEVS